MYQKHHPKVIISLYSVVLKPAPLETDHKAVEVNVCTCKATTKQEYIT